MAIRDSNPHRVWRVEHDRGSMRFFFILIGAAILVTSVSGVALAWDSSYILYSTLDQQTPTEFYGRLTHVPLNWLVLQVSHLTSNPFVLQAAFGLVYGALTLAALAASWWMVRDRAPSLFIWAALGIALANLPGQVCSVCQANLDVQLFFPVLLWILIGAPRGKTAVVVLLSAAIFFFHPVAIALFAVAAGAGGLLALFRDERRGTYLVVTAVAAVLATAAFVKFQLTASPYELNQLSQFPVVLGQIRAVLSGMIPSRGAGHLPDEQLIASGLATGALAAVACGWIAALSLVFDSFRSARRKSASRTRWPRLIALAGVVLAGELLIVWAADTRQWSQEVNYRQWVLFAAMPFMGAAVMEALWQPQTPWREEARIWEARRIMSQVIAVIFLVVLAEQSFLWRDLTSRLREAMVSSPDTCVAGGSIPWLEDTPLSHWSLTSYSLLLQGRIPTKVVIPGHGCATVSLLEGLPVALFGPGDWDLRQWDKGWFDLRQLGEKLVAQQKMPPSCQFPFTTGWFGIEEDGRDWWRWTSGRGLVRVFVRGPTRARMTGEIVSLRQPNQIEIWVNGVKREEVIISLAGFQPFAPLTVGLEPGENNIEFSGSNAPMRIPTDSRLLAFAVKDLALGLEDGVTICR